MSLIYEQFDQATLDQQYNNRASVFDFNERMAAWFNLSLSVKHNTQCLENISYGDHEQERLDLYPSKKPNAPVLIFFHGGDFTKLCKDHAAFVAPNFVNAGVSCMIADFPMRPTHTITQIRDSVRKLIQWTWQHGANYDIDPTQIYISGSSSGSNLCCQLLMTNWETQHIPQSVIKGAILLGPLADWAPVKLTYRQKYLELTDDEIEFMSVTRYLGERVNCPVIVVNGSNELDEYQRQGQWLSDHWMQLGNKVNRFLLPGHDHFNIVDTWANGTSEPFAETMRMIKNKRNNMHETI